MGDFLSVMQRQRVETPPTPKKHPLRNFDPDKLAALMNDPRFMVDTQGMSPQEYGMHLSGLTGKSIVDLQNQLSDPQSSLSQAQKTDLSSRLGRDIGTRQITLPGARGYKNVGEDLQEVIVDPAGKEGYAAGSYASKDVTRGITRELLDAMGRQDLIKDFVVWSSVATDTTKRHELAHKGVNKLEEKGFNISKKEEEDIMHLFDYALGDEKYKRNAVLYFKNRDNTTIGEAYNKYKDLIKKLQTEMFKELGGVPIPEPLSGNLKSMGRITESMGGVTIPINKKKE